jgi:SulP family sulfate permease
VTAGHRARPSRPSLLLSLRGYQRDWIAGDLVAGVTLLAIAVPEQIATARLGGMPPVTALYAFVAGSLAFALLGCHPQMSVGADSTIAPLFAAGVGAFAASGSQHYVELMGVLAVLVGVIVSLVWLLRLGWIAQLLSAPILTGFLAGVAVVIVVHQLPDLLGLPATTGSTLHRIHQILANLHDTNGWTLLIGIGSLAIVAVVERVDRRLPGALVAVVVSMVAVDAFDLHTAHGVAVLGTVAHGAPHLGLPGLSSAAITDLAPLAGVVALVVVTQSASTSRAFVDRSRPVRQDVGRDLLGVGAGSAVAGLVGAFPVNASPARTGVVMDAGGRTQAAGLWAVAGTIATIPALGLLANLPLATLAALLIYVATRLFHFHDLEAIRRFDALEFALALVTLLTVALVGVPQGIAVAIGLAILDRTRLSARPQLHVLGRLPGTTSWTTTAIDTELEQVPGVLVLLFASPLWYANAVRFQSEVRDAISASPTAPRAVVLDALGMTDIDYTGMQALTAVLDDLDGAHISFAIARAGAHARENLERGGVLDRIGRERLFPSVETAVRAVSPGCDALDERTSDTSGPR